MALAAGIAPDELQHVAVLGISTLGFPASMRAMSWITDCLPRSKARPLARPARGLTHPAPILHPRLERLRRA